MKSMTGYGSAEGKVGQGTFFAEVRSVNSRFLDLSCKLPPSMYVLEPDIKKIVQNKILRGKIDVFCKEKTPFAEAVELSVNRELVKQYRKCLDEIGNMLGSKASSHLLEVVDLKELVMFREKKVDMRSMWKQMEKVLHAAIAKYDAMRLREGQALKRDQNLRLSNILRVVLQIEKRSAQRAGESRKKIESRIRANINGGNSPLSQNGALSVTGEKSDITEEVTRLKSHIQQYRQMMQKSGAVGRQLDFLIQEMHREINTIGSKACDGTIAGLVVQTKAEVEKLREQVQNVE